VFPRVLLITVALAVAPSDLAAQSLVCQTIRPGETASTVARRITGRADSLVQPWFRIVDRSRRIIPKARYDRVRAGWHACVPTTRRRSGAVVAGRAGVPRIVAVPQVPEGIRQLPVALAQAPVAVAHAPGAVAQTRLAAAPPIRRRQPLPAAPPSRDPTVNLVLLGLGAALFGGAIGFAWQGVEQFLRQREAIAYEMQKFGYVFVKDFERPLHIEGMTSPIRARLRCSPGNRRLEILVAPIGGRRYPNLDDHRRNVEYDVERITQRLCHTAFVRRPLRAEGSWVVIPFHFELGPKTGAVV
jgi:hypothetical protein